MMRFVGQPWSGGLEGWSEWRQGGRMTAGWVIWAIIKYKESLELIIDDDDEVCWSAMVRGVGRLVWMKARGGGWGLVEWLVIWTIRNITDNFQQTFSQFSSTSLQNHYLGNPQTLHFSKFQKIWASLLSTESFCQDSLDLNLSKLSSLI